MSRTRTALVAVIGLLLAAGCAGEGDEPAGDDASARATSATVTAQQASTAEAATAEAASDAYVAEADEICRRALDEAYALEVEEGKRPTGPEVFARIERMAADLKKLTPPPGEEATVQRLHEAIDAWLAVWRKFLATQKPDGTEDNVLGEAMFRTSAKIAEVAGTLGLLNCGPLRV
jgi:hypothetical protein